MEKPASIIITGAAGTIGRATVRAMAANAESLVLLDQSETGIASLLAEFPGAVAAAGDITDAGFVQAQFDRAAERGLAAVILCAGIEGTPDALEDCADEMFDRVLDVNVKGTWLGLKHALKHMKARRAGSIVALSSIAGVMASPLLAPYAASKHAVLGLVRTAAREAAPFGVRVNAVCPAPTQSAMMQRIDGALNERFPARLGGGDAAKSVPMQRYAQPDEIARAICFLCSDAASFSTGTTTMVDGGISCR